MGESEFAGGNMDIQMMERLARIIAKEVVDDLKAEVRAEVRDEIRKEMRAYFGDMTPTQHAVEHSHLSRMLGRLDKAAGSFLGGVASKIGVALVAILLIGVVAWGKQQWAQ